MPGKNTTGLPNTDDYLIGRGELFVADLDANGRPKGFRTLGNAPALQYSVEKETIEHTSSLSGARNVDKEVEISTKITINVTLDEFNDENLALVFSGDTASHTNVAVAGFAEWEMVPAGTIEIAKNYDIINSSYARAYDIQQASDVTIKTTNASPVTLVENTDYTLDLNNGTFFLLSSSTAVATAITNLEGLDVTLAANASAEADIDEVRAQTQSSPTVALKYVGINAANNDEKFELSVHKISLKANGDLDFIGDDFAQIQLTGVAERNDTFSDSPFITTRTVPNQTA